MGLMKKKPDPFFLSHRSLPNTSRAGNIENPAAERQSSAAAAFAELNHPEKQHGPRSVCSNWFGGAFTYGP